MDTNTIRALLAASLLTAGAAGSALAQGGGQGGSAQAPAATTAPLNGNPAPATGTRAPSGRPAAAMSNSGAAQRPAAAAPAERHGGVAIPGPGAAETSGTVQSGGAARAN